MSTPWRKGGFSDPVDRKAAPVDEKAAPVFDGKKRVGECHKGVCGKIL